MNEEENFILNQDKMTQYYSFTPNLSESQLSKLRKAYNETIPANSHALCITRLHIIIRDLTKTRRRRQRERHKTKGLMSKNNRYARAF